MTQTINIINPSEIRKNGTQALLNALGPIGMARYMEQFDNGGSGDYTKEKYDQPNYTIDDILAMRK